MRFSRAHGHQRWKESFKPKAQKGQKKINRMNKTAIWLIGRYQSLSFLFPSQCRYIPTCSCYAKEAFRKHHFFKALKYSLLRILRCHPLAQGGFDPIP
jgi:putative membrane protein insertion efficiency factor